MENISLEEKLELYDSSPVVIYTCKPHGDFAATFISRGVSAQLGWEASDFLNDPGFWASHIHPDDKERVFAGLSTLFEEGHYSHEYRFQHKDGSYRWMNDVLRLDRDASGTPVRMVGYWTDINATRRQAEQSLTDSETRYQQLAELSPDGMFVHVDGEIVFANASLAKILAVPSPEDLLGTQAFDLHAPEHLTGALQRRDDLLRGKVLKLEQCEFLRSDGSRVPVERAGTRISWDGNLAILVLVRDVSDREAAAKVARAQEQHLSGVLTNIADAVVTIDDRGLIESLNSAAENMFGFAADEVMGQNVSMLMPEPDRSAHDGYIDGYQKTGGGQIIGVGAREVTALHKQGHTFPMELTVSEVTLDDGRIFIGAMRDITERKQAEDALRKSEERYELAVKGSNAGLWDWNIETDEHHFSPRWKEILGYDEDELDPHVDIFYELLHPDDHDRTRRAVEAHLKDRVPYDLEYQLRHKDGGYVWVHAAGQAVWDENGEPVRMAGSLTNISDRKRAEQALTDSETRYRQLAELSPDGMFVHVDGEIVFANASLAKILAAPSPSDLLGKQAFEIIAPEYHAAALQRRKRIMRREALELEVSEVVRFDGSRVPVERTGTLVSWDNTPAVLVLVRDVSERDAAAKALHESEERFRGVVENSPAALSMKDLEGRFRLINPRFTEWFGGQPEEVIGKTAHDISTMQFSDAAVALDRKVVETGGTHELEHDYPFPDGTLHSLALTKFPVLGPDNKIIGTGTISSDVTERKQAEKALVESRDQLRLITDNLPVLIAYIDAEQRYRFVNKTGTEWHARPVEEIVGRTVPEILGQESEKIRPRIDRAFAGEKVNYTENITYSDGVTRTTRATYVPHYGVAGGVEGYFILAEDISELEQAEDALRESEAHLRAIVDNSPSAIFLKDLDGRYIFVNRVWHDMYNPTGADIIGKTVYDFFPPEIANPATAVDAKVLETGVPIVDEKRLPTSGGGSQNVLQTKFPVYDGDGNIIALGIVNTDITERVAVEQALRESEARFRGVIENSPAALSLKDLEGRFRLINPRFTEWFGGQPEEVIGKTPHDISTMQFADAAVALDRKVIETGETHELELDIQFADVTVHSLALTKFPVLGPDNKINGTGTINSDVTERNKAEQKAQEQAEELAHIQRLNAVGQLSSALAHELNQPLTATMSYLQASRQLLKNEDEERAAKVPDLLDKAADQVNRAGAVVHRIRGFVDKREFALAEEDINEAVEEACSIALIGARDVDVDVTFDLDDRVLPVLIDTGSKSNRSCSTSFGTPSRRWKVAGSVN